MRGATDPVTSLDSGRPAPAPGATNAPPTAGLQAPLQEEEEEEMGRRGRGRGKTRRKHVNEEQESDASSARASGAEEAEEEAEESESYRAKAPGTTKKRKQDTTKNKNFSPPFGADQSLTARNIEDPKEDYDEFVLPAPPADMCGPPAALAAQEEGDKGTDMEMDDDIAAQEEGDKGEHMETDVNIMLLGDPKVKELPAELSEQEQGDTGEDSETDDDIIWVGDGGKKGYESHRDKSDLPAAVDAQEDLSEGEEMEAGDFVFSQSVLKIVWGGEWRKEGDEGHHDKSDIVAPLVAQEEGVKGEGMKMDDNISSRGESEEETQEAAKTRMRREELNRAMKQKRLPECLEALRIQRDLSSRTSISDKNKLKDTYGEYYWEKFYVPYARELKTMYEFAEKAERYDWSNKLKEWPCDIPKGIKRNKEIIVQKRGEIGRLKEIQRVSEFCESLVTWKPYIKHGDNIDTCLKKCCNIPDDVSTSLVIQAIQLLKFLLFAVECFFHPLIREGHKEFLLLAVRMHFRVKRHKLEEFIERDNLESLCDSFSNVDRAIERRKKESEEAYQVVLHKKFDDYISSSDFEKEMQKRNLLGTPERLAEELEIIKSDFKDLNRELIIVSLAERCEIIRFRHEIGAYTKCFTRLLKDEKERSQFAQSASELDREGVFKYNKDISANDKLSQMLPAIHEKYFSTLPKYYAVKGILHYLKLFPSNKDNNRKLEFEELLSSWCLERCKLIDWLWKETRSYDEKPHRAMRQPLMEGVFDRYLNVNREGC